MSEVEIQVWWVPQIPMEAFRFTVPSLEAGVMLCDALAEYDLFQFEHNVKPDYSNVGGIEWRHPVHTDGEWWAVEPDDEDELTEIRELLAH
jgi:superinfection exclusion protein gp17